MEKIVLINNIQKKKKNQFIATLKNSIHNLNVQPKKQDSLTHVRGH